MDLELDYYNKQKELSVLDINSLTWKSLEEITDIVEKTIVIDVVQWIAKIVLSWLPDEWIFLWQTETKHLKTLIWISVNTIINSIDYSKPENKLRN